MHTTLIGNRAARESLPAQLSIRIDALQEGLRKLAATSSLKDIAVQFTRILQEMFPRTKMDLLYRPAEGAEWERFVENGARGIERLAGWAETHATSVCSILEDPDGLCFVQRLGDRSSVGLLLSRDGHHAKFTRLDIASCCIFLQLFENAYRDMQYRRAQKDLVFSLNHRILQLNSLIDTGIEVSKLEQNDEPHHLALLRAVAMANASRGIVTIHTGNTVRQEFVFPEGTHIDRGNGTDNCISSSFTFLKETYMFELFDKETRAGIKPFEETDKLLLDALARQVHASLENRYLLQQSLEKERIEREMAVAASIQKKILPVALPVIDGYDLAGMNIPSKSVGGDYFNCVLLPSGKYALVIADVTGKGVPAALLVSSVHAYLSAFLQEPMDLSALAGKLNRALYQDTTDDKFVTAFLALLNPATGEIECLSAGHNPAFLLKKNNEVQAINAGGLPLAMFGKDLPYKSERVTLEKGERFLLYTDGVTEAQNLEEELYENAHPLDRFLAASKASRAENLVAELISDVRKFTGLAPQSDDITAMCLQRL